MNTITKIFGGETDPVKKFTGEIVKHDVVLIGPNQFAIMSQKGKYKDIMKERIEIKYGFS